MSLLTLFSDPVLFLLWIAAVLIALSVHEFSHALVATSLGDSTAKRLGRLTLNPLAHIDWFGLVTLVLVSFGWGKPVPFNPYNLRDQKWGPVYISMAGPVSNLVMLTVSGLLIRLLGPALGADNLLVIFLVMCFMINMALMLFNLIPLPPLDGSKVLIAALHKPKYMRARIFVEQYGSWILMVLIILDILLGTGIISAALSVPRAWLVDLFGLNHSFGL